MFVFGKVNMSIEIAKHYAYVISDYTEDGRVIPKKILWDDGYMYEIERIIRTKRYNGLNTSGVIKQYTCECNGCVFDLIHEGEDKWVKV